MADRDKYSELRPIEVNVSTKALLDEFKISPRVPSYNDIILTILEQLTAGDKKEIKKELGWDE